MHLFKSILFSFVTAVVFLTGALVAPEKAHADDLVAVTIRLLDDGTVHVVQELGYGEVLILRHRNFQNAICKLGQRLSQLGTPANIRIIVGGTMSIIPVVGFMDMFACDVAADEIPYVSDAVHPYDDGYSRECTNAQANLVSLQNRLGQLIEDPGTGGRGEREIVENQIRDMEELLRQCAQQNPAYEPPVIGF